MLKFFVKTLGLVVALALSGAAGAVGMGGISVATALGEPLKAEIDLVSVGKADKNKMSARLATPDAFKGAGLDYPATLPPLKFQVETRANGEPYLKVTTSQPVNEPFVSLLVELTWSSGQLLREYTFLLDPPGFKPEQPKAPEIQPLAPSIGSADQAGAAAKEEPMPIRATAPMDEKVFAASGVAAANKPTESNKHIESSKVAESGKPAVGSNVATGSITVKRGDTLSKIANETKAPDISLERMLVAMYRANEEEFDGKNMNRIQTGKILRVPEDKEVDQVAQEEAVKEIRAQAADWNAYRLKLAAATGHSSEQAPKQIVTGKISTTVADKTPAAKESAKEVVRLSKGEAPGDKTAAGGNGKAAQDKLHSMEEEATARNKTLKESNERIALLEKNIKEMQRLIELKGQLAQAAKTNQSKAEPPVPNQAAGAENKPAMTTGVGQGAASAAVRTATVAQDTQPASAVKPARPAPSKVETPPPSLLDEIIDEPLYLGGGAVVLLGLGGLAFMLARRRGKAVASKEEADVGTHIVAPVAPSPDTGDFTRIATADEIVSPIEQEDVDPISEADLFLNFGRDVQAEEILKDALNKNPGNQKIRLKLLSIYANRKDTKTFSGIAREVQASGDAAAWAQAAEMGRKLDPSNPMYGGDDSAVAQTVEASQDEVNAVAQTTHSLDFDLGLGATEDSSATGALDIPLEVPVPASTDVLDFDLGIGVPEDAASAVAEPESSAVQSAQADEKAETSTDLDFDLGFEVPVEAAVPEEAAADRTMALSEPISQQVEAAESLPVGQDTALDFDITAEHPSLSATQQELAPEQTESPVASAEEAVYEVPGLDQPSPAVVQEDVAAVPAPVEEEMTFSLDFPVEEPPVQVAEATAPAEEAPAADETVPEMPAPVVAKDAGAIDFSEINLNLDEPVSAPAEEVKDTQWHDVATKLDLARAYQEMGDASGAREILQEVLNEGDAQQRATAEVMLEQLTA